MLCKRSFPIDSHLSEARDNSALQDSQPKQSGGGVGSPESSSKVIIDWRFVPIILPLELVVAILLAFIPFCCQVSQRPKRAQRPSSNSSKSSSSSISSMRSLAAVDISHTHSNKRTIRCWFVAGRVALALMVFFLVGTLSTVPEIWFSTTMWATVFITAVYIVRFVVQLFACWPSLIDDRSGALLIVLFRGKVSFIIPLMATVYGLFTGFVSSALFSVILAFIYTAGGFTMEFWVSIIWASAFTFLYLVTNFGRLLVLL